ncbi:4-hydroxy-2-oxoheptanedioate aldolase [Advenella incenata]|uniref:4-hydroxy-2-oxoheptanedioate aldolase n=1 Tax=Advenella incenata TaxID=267800 RepID=A0A4Q7VFU1_9BURK|nr:aldolase/citrate lyase family protein [Advenella incenata]RZT94860.1 4-hydroxy-2-oxoheptanedioate aldolase [Advenella incenata]
MNRVNAKSKFFEMFERNERPLGVFVSCMDPASTEALADAGFDYVVLDGEHGKMGRVDVETHSRAAAARGIIPLVRILENSQTLIQAMLDSGAQGVIIPHLETAHDAQRALAASLYSPVGKRGMCNACYAGGYQLDSWPDHVKASNQNVLVIPLIESARAVENIKEIVAVNGIDVVFFGPGDLAAEMGLNFTKDGDRLMDSWQRVKDAAKEAGKYTLAPRGWGFDDADILIAEMDIQMLLNAGKAIVQQYKQ